MVDSNKEEKCLFHNKKKELWFLDSGCSALKKKERMEGLLLLEIIESPHQKSRVGGGRQPWKLRMVSGSHGRWSWELRTASDSHGRQQ